MNNYKTKRVLVTGADGFIGRALCSRLMAHSDYVHGIVRKSVVKRLSGVLYHELDLCDFYALHEVMREIKPHIIFHLAGYVYGQRNIEEVIPNFSGNLHASVNLFVSAGQSHCERLLVAGTMETLYQEQGDNSAHSPYAIAKHCSDLYAKYFQAQYRLPVCRARLFMVYGPGQLGEHRNKLIPSVICSLLRGQAPVVGSGRRFVDWIYIDDVVEALCRLGIMTDLTQTSFDIGSGNLVTVKDVVNKLSEMINPDIAVQFGAIPDRGFEIVAAANSKQTSGHLNWKPEIDLDQGLLKTIAWIKSEMAIR